MLPLNVIHILTNGFGFNKLDIIMNTYGTNNSGGENLHASFSDFIIGDKVSLNSKLSDPCCPNTYY